MYYSDKLDTLRDLFGSEKVSLEADYLRVDALRYPIVDDVIVLLDPEKYPESLACQIGNKAARVDGKSGMFADDIQFTFGEEWGQFSNILPEHENEFRRYFDLVNISALRDARVCDLGCGIGRWSYFLQNRCRELILIDFSDAIFVTRRNLSGARGALFFMCDLKCLPFRKGFADFLFSLGVLHHLPTDALQEVRALRSYSPAILIYLYYDVENRPPYFRPLLRLVTILRKVVSRARNPAFRSAFTWTVSIGVYYPLVILGKALRPFGLASRVPLYDGYKEARMERIRQDVYDRFFTGIEQRFSRREILDLQDTFTNVTISDQFPYWHFLCHR